MPNRRRFQTTKVLSETLSRPPPPRSWSRGLAPVPAVRQGHQRPAGQRLRAAGAALLRAAANHAAGPLTARGPPLPRRCPIVGPAQRGVWGRGRWCALGEFDREEFFRRTHSCTHRNMRANVHTRIHGRSHTQTCTWRAHTCARVCSPMRTQIPAPK